MIQTFFFILLALFVSGHVQGKDSLSKEDKKSCESLKKQIETLEKDKAAIDKELLGLEEKLSKSNARFEEHRAKLNGMSDCSKGNPNNSQECNQVLEGLASSGQEMASTKEQMKAPAKRKNVIENDLLTPRAMQNELHCP